MTTTPQTDDVVKFIMDQLKQDSPTLMSDHPYYLLDLMAGLCRKLENDLYRVIKLNEDKTEIMNSLNNKCAEWEEKAATWLASPEAAKRLEGYRELGMMVEKAEAQRDELLGALKPFADIDLTNPFAARSFGFDVLRARAAITKVTGEET